MIDPVEAYQVGLERLLEQLGVDHPSYNDVLSFQARLLENIHRKIIHGTDETQRSNLSVIIGNVNDLTMKILGVSFISYCGLSISSHSSHFQELSDGLLLSIGTYIKAVQDVAQKAYDMFCNENDLWEAPCRRISDSFHHIDKPTLLGIATFHSSSNTLINLLEVKLNYIDDQIYKLLLLIETLCPICRKASLRVRTLRTEVCDKLQILLEKDLREVSMLIIAPLDKA